VKTRGERMDIQWYARKVLKYRLYPYQAEIINAILDSVFGDKGLTFSVMLARQMGKNEISAVLEAYLLTCVPEDHSIVKAAPTYKPQIVNSRLRLISILEKNPAMKERMWTSQGYIIGAKSLDSKPNGANKKAGPRVMFLSASPDAHIMGATASLLLEVDEAQDVSIEKFNRDLRPMCSTTNATTVLYGTAWSEDTLLAQMKVTNQELERRDGIRRHFEYDWRTLAKISPYYKTFVEREIQRLGEEHLTIRTQYCLRPISGESFLLKEEQRYLLRGKHDWLDGPREGDYGYYIMGMDVGGEDWQKRGKGQPYRKRDSTVLTIARVVTNELDLRCLEIVHQVQWTGKPYIEQYNECVALCELWEIRRLVIDKTGLGEGLAGLLSAKLGDDKVLPFHFTRQSKSKLAYELLAMVKSGRLKMYKEESAPDDINIEAWKQLKVARYRVPGENLIEMYVAPEEGHDDFLTSIALCCEAVRTCVTPTLYSRMIPPPPIGSFRPGKRWEE